MELPILEPELSMEESLVAVGLAVTSAQSTPRQVSAIQLCKDLVQLFN